jgi:leucyl/phenylalanyl-tRNA--protein transferase
MASNGDTGPAAARRDILFREAPTETVRRWGLGLLWAMKRDRARGLLGLGRMCLSETLGSRSGLPDPEAALDIPLGLAGFVRDLSVPALMEAYERGLYPFSHVGPPKWWSPPDRSVLFMDEFHLAKRVRSRMRQNRHTVTFDRDFEEVIKACSEPREGKLPLTWITPRIMRAYAEMFDAGHAHCFAVRDPEGALVGGGYGVAVGGVFVIESQFARESHASQIGFAVLHWHLARWGFVMCDNKFATETVERMGFRDIRRTEYLARLAAARTVSRPGRWEVEAGPAEVAAPAPNESGKKRPRQEFSRAA